MAFPEPTRKRFLVTTAESERIFAPRGLAALHPGQVGLVWLVAALPIVVGHYSQSEDWLALGLLAMVLAAIVSWKWLGSRRPHKPLGIELTDPVEIEIVECLAWAAVTTVRRLHIENAKTLTVDGRSLDPQKLTFEGFAMCVAAAKYAGDIILRDHARLRHDLTRGLLMRLSFLLYGYGSHPNTRRALERINQYGVALIDDDVEQYGNRVFDVWLQLFPENDIVPGGIGSLAFTRFFKYVGADVYATVLTPERSQAIRVTGHTGE